jgi:hypothetical protein
MSVERYAGSVQVGMQILVRSAQTGTEHPDDRIDQHRDWDRSISAAG